MIHFKWKIKIIYNEWFNVDKPLLTEIQSRIYPLFTSDEMFIQQSNETWIMIPLPPIKQLVITYEQ